MVAPKGWRLNPSDLKFYMSRKSATMRCWPLRSWVRVVHIEIEQVAQRKRSIENGQALVKASQKLPLNLVQRLLSYTENIKQLL